MHCIHVVVAAALLTSGQETTEFPGRPPPAEMYGRNAARVQRWYDLYLGRLPDRLALNRYIADLESD